VQKMAEKDFISKVASSKMGQLRQEISDLRKMLSSTEDDEKAALIKKEIMEKETYYNILADREKVRG
jgi:hypothetical protein